jgi:hypothetical protein
MIESWESFSMKQIREFMVELGYPIEYTYSLDRRMCIVRVEALVKKKVFLQYNK